jgi:hypothetical protein
MRALIVGLGLCAACGTPDPRHDPATFAASLSEGACAACVLDFAAPEEAVCSSDPACRALSACIAASDRSLTSVGGCYDGRPAGRPAYDVVERGVQRAICTDCAGQCPSLPSFTGAVTDAGDAGAACAVDFDAGDGVSPCLACARASCARDLGACVPGTDCAKYLDCVATEQHPDDCEGSAAGAAAAALAACARAQCAASCGL